MYVETANIDPFMIPIPEEWKESKGEHVNYKTCQNCLAFVENAGLEKIWPRSDWYSAMYICIPPGGWINKHHDGHGRDQDIRGEYSKYHIPLKTNVNCINRIWCPEPVDFHLVVGKVYKIDNELPHASWNHGETDRIHLVMEIYD